MPSLDGIKRRLSATEFNAPVGLTEKESVNHVELVPSDKSSEDQPLYDEKTTKRLVRKMDWNLLPFLSLLYLLSFLDRTNIGNARLAGLETTLHMKGLNYNVRASDLSRPN